MEANQPKSNKTLLIVGIAAAVLCCCCFVLAIAVGLTMPNIQQMFETQVQPDIPGVPAPLLATSVPQSSAPTEAAGVMLRQWASSASASSEYGTSDWSASQATGAPSLTDCGDNSKAWASSSSTGKDTLELTFDQAVTPQEVNIHISFTPNQVVLVELIDTGGQSHSVYAGVPAETECPYVLNVPVDDAQYTASQVRITVDQTTLGNWNEIDAVELIGLSAG